jgi:beta-N-acetylhexosaminidase
MVKTGLEILLQSQLGLLKDRRVGFVTHPPAVLPDLSHGLDALLGAGIQLVALFGPEHGFDASAADGAPVEHSMDRRTRLKVYSLYGQVLEPSPSMLADIDTLVFDLQDAGARFYTFISTLFYVLRGAAAAGKQVILLDRPNPVNGCSVAGPTIEPEFKSFVGIVPMPIRHGLTVGELANYFNSNFGFYADLTVIPMEGWQRSMWFDQTGLPWVPLSPGMPCLNTAIVYPGMCFLEGTNLSEGRGTALPFEIAGAPWLDGPRLAGELNALALPGVRFRPVNFIPTSSKHAYQACQGVQVHVTDRETFDSILSGLHLIAACREQAPVEFSFLDSSWEGRKPHFDLLAGSAHLRQGLEASEPVHVLAQTWDEDLVCFERIRQEIRLYP